MKNLFKIHPLTYTILFSVLLCGYFNYFLVIATILIIHDLGHIFFIKLFKFQISKITILPFGSIINTNINSSDKSWSIFFVSIAGILFQLLLFPIMSILNNFFINDISYNIFLYYNKIILLFNVLPIVPLDGSKILLTMLESAFSYKKALKIINYLSLILIILLCLYIAFNGLNSYLIIIFLIYKTYEEIKNHKYIFNRFLLERHLYSNSKQKIKYIKTIKNIYKNRYNFINNQSEDKVLKNYYLS